MLTVRDEEQKPAQQDVKPNVRVRFSLVNQHGNSVELDVLPTTEIRKIMDAYASKANIDVRSFRLIDDEGNNLLPHHTVQQVGIQTGDTISVNAAMEGGGQ